MAKYTYNEETHDDGKTYSYADMGVNGPPRGEQWQTCDVCGFGYPVSELRAFRGKMYCVPGGCSRDIRGTIRKEAARRQRGGSRRPERTGVFGDPQLTTIDPTSYHGS